MLVKSSANSWSGRMQLTGQWHCKLVVKWNELSHPRLFTSHDRPMPETLKFRVFSDTTDGNQFSSLWREYANLFTQT